MKLELDTDANLIRISSVDGDHEFPLYSTEGFEALSRAWLKVGWNQKYPYTFSWWGRPMIQNPEDVMRIQEVIFRVQPDYVVGTGVAHGGSLIFYASLMEALGKGEVIGIDIEIRPHNRQAIEAHPMSHRIQMVEGSSIDEQIVAEVKRRITPGSTVLVVLDSNHSKSHVLEELEKYCDLVSKDSYIVATDGIMNLVHDTPRGNPDWVEDNPTEAALDFAKRHSEFVLEQPDWPFSESDLVENVTHWPGAWLRRM